MWFGVGNLSSSTYLAAVQSPGRLITQTAALFFFLLHPHDSTKAARLTTYRIAPASSFVSGLRSEHSSPPRSTLAGSSVNRAEQHTRNTARSFIDPKILFIERRTRLCGVGTCCGDRAHALLGRVITYHWNLCRRGVWSMYLAGVADASATPQSGPLTGSSTRPLNMHPGTGRLFFSSLRGSRSLGWRNSIQTTLVLSWPIFSIPSALRELQSPSSRCNFFPRCHILRNFLGIGLSVLDEPLSWHVLRFMDASKTILFSNLLNQLVSLKLQRVFTVRILFLPFPIDIRSRSKCQTKNRGVHMSQRSHPRARIGKRALT